MIRYFVGALLAFLICFHPMSVVATNFPTPNTSQERVINWISPGPTDVAPYTNKDKGDNNSLQESEDMDTINLLDLSSLVIGWSGFALAVLTIIATILGFFGFHELRDLHKARIDVKSLEKQYTEYVEHIQQLETNYQERVSDLTSKFESEAQTIMLATYFYVCGSSSYQQSKYHEAVSYLQKAIILLPKNTDAICLLGRAYNFLGKKDKSHECFVEAISIDTHCSAAYRGLAAWYRFSDIEKALENAKLAVKYAPNNYEVLNYLGQLYRDHGQTAAALQTYIDSLKIRAHPDTEFFLSILYAAEGRRDRAKLHISNAIDKYDNDEEFATTRMVWKTMARWVKAILNGDNSNALKTLEIVVKQIDSEKTKKVVWGHISFLLSSMKVNKQYIATCKRKIGA